MIRPFATISLILLMTVLFFCNIAQAATNNSANGPAEATRQSVEQFVHQFNEAILNQDSAALNALISADYTSGGDQDLTKPEFIDQILTNNAPEEQSVDSMSVKLNGDTAVVSGLATSNWISPAGLDTVSFRWVNVVVLGENGWQLVYSDSTILQSDMDC